MKTVIHLPRPAEVKSLQYDQATGQIEIEHRFLPGQVNQSVLCLTVEGRNGNSRSQMLKLNGNSGRYTVADLEQEIKVPFDMTPDELARWQQKQRDRRAAAQSPQERRDVST